MFGYFELFLIVFGWFWLLPAPGTKKNQVRGEILRILVAGGLRGVLFFEIPKFIILVS